MRSTVILIIVCFAAPFSAQAAVTADRLGDAPDPKQVALIDTTASGHDIIIVDREPNGGAGVLLNGKAVASDKNIRGITISPAGKKYAYVVSETPPDGAGYHVVTNEAKGVSYENIIGGEQATNQFARLYFSPNGQHLAYVASDKNEQFAVVDGKEEKHFGHIYNFTYSDDGGHWAYRARDVANKSETYVVDGKPGEDRNVVQFLTFIPLSSDVAFTTLIGTQLGRVIMNAKEIDPAIERAGHIAFSGDGKHYAFSGTHTDRKSAWRGDTVIIVDGQEQVLAVDALRIPPGAPPDVAQVALSPDGSHLAYVRREALSTGKKAYTPTPGGTRVLSSISQSRAVWDGQTGPVVDNIATLTFSPDGTRMAYAAQLNNQWKAFIDNKPGPAYEMVAPQMAFSGDSKHIAYAAKSHNKWIMVLDGNELTDYEPIHANASNTPGGDCHYAFDPGGTLVYIATKAGQLYRVHASTTQ